MSNFPSVQCVRGESGPPDNVPESPVLTNTPEWQWPGTVPNRRHLPSPCELRVSVIAKYIGEKLIYTSCIWFNSFSVLDHSWLYYSQLQGVGVVVSGTCLKGVIRVNDTLLLGPNGLGDFIPMPIKSIHRKRMPVREVRGGQTASFALKKIKVHDVRKGQVLVDPSLNPTSCWEFKVRFMPYLMESDVGFVFWKPLIACGCHWLGLYSQL